MFNTLKSKILKQLKHYSNNNVFAVITQQEYKFDLNKMSAGHFTSFGKKNPDKIFYVIWCNNMGSGFFSNFSSVLCHLKLADMAGMIPIVDFMNFKTLYNEKESVNATTNAWEYYFDPVTSFSLAEVYESKNVFFSSGSYPAFMSYSITQIPGLYEDIYSKYIRLDKNIEETLQNQDFSNRVLGIHFRGQEMKLAAGHSFPPTEQQMIKYTDEIIQKFKIDKIFVVTEEQRYLDLYKKKYGDKVMFNNSYRTYDINSYNLHPRENHRYKLGLEVLVDSLMLSKCTGLLCGDSNVSEFARFANNNKFEFVYKIYNGVNSQHSLVARYLYKIKKILPAKFGGLADEVSTV